MESPARAYRRGQNIALLGLVVNSALALTKFLAGVSGHSYALLADAVESCVDVLGSAITWGGLRVAARPADREHPYGHGKAEALAAVLAAGVIVLAAGMVAWQALHSFFVAHPAPHWSTLVVLGTVVIIKEGLYWLGRAAARTTNSQALRAEAGHHRSDAFTSGLAAIGISIALLGGPRFEIADGIAALVASAFIALNGVRLAVAPLHELMDRESPEMRDRVRQVASDVPGVVDIEKILARKSGLHYLVDMHVEVDPSMTVEQAHRVSHAVKDCVRQALPQIHDVLIHIEPAGQARHARPPACGGGFGNARKASAS